MNVIDHARKEKTPAVLFFADTEKAFDQVNWSILKQVLKGGALEKNFRNL